MEQHAKASHIALAGFLALVFAMGVGRFAFTPLLPMMQDEGLLPNPLPEYSIPAVEYVFGYSLWIVIGFAVACAAVREGLLLLCRGRRIKTLLADRERFVRRNAAKRRASE